MSSKKASNVKDDAATNQPKSRYSQFMAVLSPDTKVKADDVPLFLGMNHVREQYPNFMTLDPILQTILLESTGKYLVLASSYSSKTTTYLRMKDDSDSIPHSLRYKIQLAALPQVKRSEGYKAASAKANGIISTMNLQLKGCILDVSKLTIADLREQIIKSIVGSLLLIGEGLYISELGCEKYYRHRIFIDLMYKHGDMIVNAVRLAKTTREELARFYKNHHKLQEMPNKSIPVTIANRYVDPLRLSGNRRIREDLIETPMGTQQMEDGGSLMDLGMETESNERGTLTPTVIGDDRGELTTARRILLQKIANTVEVVFGNAWAVYSLEEDRLQCSRALRKMHSGAIHEAKADEITAILDQEGNVNLRTLNALIDKKVNDGIRASKQQEEKRKSSVAKKDSRGHDGAAGQKKSVEKPSTSDSKVKASSKKTSKKKQKKTLGGKGKGKAAVGGRGNGSSNATKGRGGDRSKNGSGGRGRGKSS